MQTDTEIIRGTTNVFEITVTDAQGELYDITGSEKLLFGVKRNYNDKSYIFVKAVSVSLNGVYTVTLRPEDTDLCDCSKYLYDVAIQSGDDFFNVIEASNFIVKKNVTSWGCVE